MLSWDHTIITFFNDHPGLQYWFVLVIIFLKRILNERTGFYFQSEIMDMKEEMMNDAIDDVMGDEEDDEER